MKKLIIIMFMITLGFYSEAEEYKFSNVWAGETLKVGSQSIRIKGLLARGIVCIVDEGSGKDVFFASNKGVKVIIGGNAFEITVKVLVSNMYNISFKEIPVPEEKRFYKSSIITKNPPAKVWRGRDGKTRLMVKTTGLDIYGTKINCAFMYKDARKAIIIIGSEIEIDTIRKKIKDNKDGVTIRFLNFKDKRLKYLADEVMLF